jgi:hypothetical protein
LWWTRPPDSPLEYEQDKADFVRPSFLNFRFLDGSAYNGFETNYLAEIQIFRIDEFRRMYSIAEYRMKEFDMEIESLRSMLKTPPAELGELRSPLYPVKQHPVFPVIGEQHLVKAKFEAVPFGDGDGMAFVTQFSSGEVILTNQGLVWVFQGITGDGRYYVYAQFPTSISILPDRARSDDEFPRTSWSGGPTVAFEKYARSIVRQLNDSNNDAFNPSLDNLKGMLGSLEIK